eukprot:TRINITY_DN17266_c0_g1_i2.p1 TRINITY_DN17266_c0_g1~~TRINITY_DN17266_c0_g1_i2.p1  ORF type:complete len:1709 (+),score=685.67 TRINITY_DN17266_c0_g1_i2:587-5128(+)
MAGACDYIWSAFRSRICPKLHVRIGPAPSPSMFHAWSALLRLLPVDAVSQERLEELLSLWQLQITQDEEWSQEMVSFLCRVSEREAWARFTGRQPPLASIRPVRHHVADRIAQVCLDVHLPYGLAIMGQQGTFTSRASELFVRMFCDDPDEGRTIIMKVVRALGEFAVEQPTGSGFVLGMCEAMRRATREMLRQCGQAVFHDDEPPDWEPEAGLDVAALAERCRDLRHRFAQMLLPCGLDLLVSDHVSTGATVCSQLCELCPEIALPQLLERAQRAADVKTSSVGHMPHLFQRLLPSVLAHGTAEHKEWMLQRVQDLVCPEHIDALPQALYCTAFISAVTPFDTPHLVEWGCDIWRRMLAVAESVEWPDGFDPACQHLLFALPPDARQQCCAALEEVVLGRVHDTGVDGKRKNHFLRLITRMCRAAALAAPQWGAALAASMQDKLLQLYEIASPREQRGEQSESDAVRLWLAQCLSVTSQTLGPAMLPLLRRQAEVIDTLLMENPRPQDWQVKAGGSLMKHTLRTLICVYPVCYGSRSRDGAELPVVEQHGARLVSTRAAAVGWHIPSEEELSEAAALLKSWLAPLLSRLRGRDSWQDAEADAARLRYIAKGGYLLLREGLFERGSDYGSCFERALSSDAHAKALREHGVDAVGLIDLLCSVPLRREDGCSEKVGAHLVQAIDGLLYDKQCAKDETYYQETVQKMQRDAGITFVGDLVPRPCAAYYGFHRWCARDSWTVQLRLGTRRCKQEGRLALRLIELGGTGLERTRELAVEAGQDMLHKLHDVEPPLQLCLKQVERTPHGQDAVFDVDGEAAARSGFAMVYDSSVLCRIWRHWPMLLALARTLLTVGYDAREELKEEVVMLFEAVFGAERRGRYYRSELPTSEEDVRAAITELLGAVSPEVAGDQTGAAAVRALSMLGQLCRGLPRNATAPPEAVLFFVDGLTHPLATARSSARAELSQCLRRLKKPVPRTPATTTLESTTTRTLPTPTKLYDYSGEPPKQVGPLNGAVTVELLESVLRFNETNDTGQESATARDAARFDTSSAQLWKGMFQLLKGELVDLARHVLSTERADPDGHTCFGRYDPSKVSEMLGGLLRALRHWQHESERDLRERSWRLVLEQVRRVLSDGRRRDLRDIEEALCHAGARHPHLGPLCDFCIDLLTSACGLRDEWRALELVGRGLMRGLDCQVSHIQFAENVVQVLAGRQWGLEFDEVRAQLAAANVYLLRMFQRHPPEGHAAMAALLADLRKEWPHGTHVILRTAGAIDRSLLLTPYVDTFAGALRDAVAAELEHDDDGELGRIVGRAVKMLPPAPALLALVDVSPLQLSKQRGRTALQYLVYGLGTCVVQGLPPAADAALRQLLLQQLRSAITAAAEEAVLHVCQYARLGPSSPRGATELLESAQAAAEQEPEGRLRNPCLRVVAGVAAGIALSCIAQADESTFAALRLVVELARHNSDGVRKRASYGAEKWRQAAVEQPVVWQQMLKPALDARGLTRKLLSTLRQRNHDA